MMMRIRDLWFASASVPVRGDELSEWKRRGGEERRERGEEREAVVDGAYIEGMEEMIRRMVMLRVSGVGVNLRGGRNTRTYMRRGERRRERERSGRH